MLPAQRNKVDISKLTPAEQQAFRLYGKLPSRPVSKSQERKYFDSGDFALAKAGKAGSHDVGKAIPRADEIPHASPSAMGMSTSAGSVGSGSPPGSIPISGSMGGASGIISPTGFGGGSSSSGGGPGSPGSGHAIPINGAGAGFGGNGGHEAGINLSMSPGRVGVGQPLASSPTRSFASPFGLAHSRSSTSPTHAHPTNPLVSRLDREGSYNGGGGGGAASPAVGSPASTPQVAGTTGNQIGRVQIRRTSQSEGSALNPTSPPTSSLANSIIPTEAREDDEVDNMELQ